MALDQNMRVGDKAAIAIVNTHARESIGDDFRQACVVIANDKVVSPQYANVGYMIDNNPMEVSHNSSIDEWTNHTELSNNVARMIPIGESYVTSQNNMIPMAQPVAFGHDATRVRLLGGLGEYVSVSVEQIRADEVNEWSENGVKQQRRVSVFYPNYRVTADMAGLRSALDMPNGNYLRVTNNCLLAVPKSVPGLHIPWDTCSIDGGEPLRFLDSGDLRDYCKDSGGFFGDYPGSPLEEAAELYFVSTGLGGRENEGHIAEVDSLLWLKMNGPAVNYPYMLTSHIMTIRLMHVD